MSASGRPPAAAPRLAVRTILEAVAVALDVPVAALRADRRLPDWIRARFMACGLAWELTEASLPVIARVMGGRDHTTVLHASRRHQEIYAQDADYALVTDAVRATLLALHARQLDAYLGRLDPVEIARRIVADPRRGVHAASTLEIMALAEHVAAQADADLSEELIAQEEHHADAV